MKLTAWRTLTASGELGTDTYDTEELAREALQTLPPDQQEEAAVIPSRWSGCLVLEGTRTDDDREIGDNALTWRELPLPFMFLPDTTIGHNEATVCGAIDAIVRDSAGKYMGEGFFDLDGEGGREAARLLAAGILRWVSADLAVSDYDVYEEGDCAIVPEDEVDDVIDYYEPDGSCHIIFRVTAGKIMGATMVPFPAFEDAVIEAVTAGGAVLERIDVNHDNPRPAELTIHRAGRTRSIEDGVQFFAHPQPLDGSAPPARAPIGATVAAAIADIPTKPPAAWFEDPGFAQENPEEDPRLVQQPSGSYACPLTITPEGRVFGHITTWDSCHIGRDDVCVPPPRSQTGYAYFLTGELPVEGCDCEAVAVGQLTFGGGHADLRLGYRAAAEHYDDVASAWADVTIGEDHIGPWIAGAVRPGITPEQLRAVQAAAPSGDWRRVGGNLELIAAHQVNVPGYPIARRGVMARVASGQPVALIASLGTVRESEADRVARLEARLEALERVYTPLLPMARDVFRSRIDSAFNGNGNGHELEPETAAT